MAPKQPTARMQIETYINNLIDGSEPIRGVDSKKLPQALDGKFFTGLEAPADCSVKVGDTFDCGHGLTAEVIRVRNTPGYNAEYAIRFYYLH